MKISQNFGDQHKIVSDLIMLFELPEFHMEMDGKSQHFNTFAYAEITKGRSISYRNQAEYLTQPHERN